MATPNLDQISKELAFKIFDPVTSGSSDGKIFTSELRLGYINRAYSTLLNMVEAFNIDKTKVFKNYYTVWTPADIEDATEKLIKLPYSYEVYDFFYQSGQGEGGYSRADYLDPKLFHSVKHGLNSYYTPSTTERYWTIIDNYIYVLPYGAQIDFYNPEIFVRNYFPEFTHNGSNDIELPIEYKNLLVLIAAIEAMADKGDQAKYQLYNNALDKQIQLLGLRSKVEASLKEEGGK